MLIDYVVVAFRSSSDLPACLDSILADAPGGSRTIVVDNASPDDSAEVAGAHPIGAEIVRSDRNLGFGGGCNLGVSRSSAEAVFLLNPDARLTAGVSSGMIAALQEDPRVGIVAPRVVDPSGQSRAASAGASPSLASSIGHFLLVGRIPILRRLFPPFYLSEPLIPSQPDWVSGAAMLVRRSAFDEIGGFDERIFMYMEDVDICERLWRAGWRVRYEPAFIVEHRIGGSQSTEQPARWYRAFHAYLLQTRGPLSARLSSMVAGLGLGIRALAYVRTRPANATRMRRAAITAFRLALLPSQPVAPEKTPS